MINEKQRVALISILASTVLAGSKIVAAIFTGSLGILSEAVHSTIDMGATVITWVAVRYSDQPPDETHHFGHEKVESVSALIATGLLFLTTGWVAWEAIHRLYTGHAEVEVTWWAAAIIAATILIDLNRRRARRTVRHWKQTPCTSPPTCGVRWWFCWALARFGSALHGPMPWPP